MGGEEENGGSPQKQGSPSEVIKENGSANHVAHDDGVEDKTSLRNGDESPMIDRDGEVSVVHGLGITSWH